MSEHRGLDHKGVTRDCIQEWHFCGARDGVPDEEPTFGEAVEFRLTRLELVRRLINVTRSLVLLEAERKELADYLGIAL